MMKVQTIYLRILCCAWWWIPIISLKQCGPTFIPRVKQYVQFSFPKAHEDFFNFQTIKVQFANKSKHLLTCSEHEPLNLLLRYRKAGTKGWQHRINIDLDSTEVIIEEDIEPCSSYQFQLRGRGGQERYSNTRVGNFNTGPNRLTRSSIETTVNQSWVEFDWVKYSDNCSEGIYFQHHKRAELAPNAQHNISLVECDSNEILVAPKFHEQRGIPVNFEFPILPLDVNVSPIINNLNLSWDLSPLQNCSEILEVNLKFYLSYLNRDTFHIISDKTLKFFEFGPSALSRQDIEEDGVRQGVIAPCQQQYLTFNLTMYGQSNNSREVNVVQGIPIMVDSKRKVTFTQDLDPECLVVKTNARGSRAMDQQNNDQLILAADGYDLVEEILKGNSASTIRPSTASSQAKVEANLNSMDLPNISRETTSAPVEVLDVTLSESNSTKRPEDIDNDADEKVVDEQEQKSQYDLISPDPVSSTDIASVDLSIDAVENIEPALYDEGENESNGIDQLDDPGKSQPYDSYDYYEPTQNALDQPIKAIEMSHPNVLTTNSTRTVNTNESIPQVAHASSRPLWLILLLVFLGMMVVLATVFFGAAAYIRIRHDLSEMTPEWESPTVNDPLQLKSNSNQEDITFVNENYKTNFENDVEEVTHV